MPIYEYICQTCKNTLDVDRKMTDKEVVPECDQCDSNMIRTYGAVGVQFKGSGFYKTDNPK